MVTIGIGLVADRRAVGSVGIGVVANRRAVRAVGTRVIAKRGTEITGGGGITTQRDAVRTISGRVIAHRTAVVEGDRLRTQRDAVRPVGVRAVADGDAAMVRGFGVVAHGNAATARSVSPIAHGRRVGAGRLGVVTRSQRLVTAGARIGARGHCVQPRRRRIIAAIGRAIGLEVVTGGHARLRDRVQFAQRVADVVDTRQRRAVDIVDHVIRRRPHPADVRGASPECGCNAGAERVDLRPDVGDGSVGRVQLRTVDGVGAARADLPRCHVGDLPLIAGRAHADDTGRRGTGKVVGDTIDRRASHGIRRRRRAARTQCHAVGKAHGLCVKTQRYAVIAAGNRLLPKRRACKS